MNYVLQKFTGSMYYIMLDAKTVTGVTKIITKGLFVH